MRIAHVYDLVPTRLQGCMMPQSLHSRIYHSDLLSRAISFSKAAQEEWAWRWGHWLCNWSGESFSLSQIWAKAQVALKDCQVSEDWEKCEFSDDEAQSFASNDLCMSTYVSHFKCYKC